MSQSWDRDATEDGVVDQATAGAPPDPDVHDTGPVSRLPHFEVPAPRPDADAEQYPKPPSAWGLPPHGQLSTSVDADTRTRAMRDLPPPPPPPTVAAQPPRPGEQPPTFVAQPAWSHQPTGQEPPEPAPVYGPVQVEPPAESVQPYSGAHAPYPFDQQPPFEQPPVEQPPVEQPPFEQQPASEQQAYPGRQPEAYPPNGYPEQSAAPAEPGRHYANPNVDYAQPGPATFPPQQLTPARHARPEDLLVPNQGPAHDQPASWGWRGRLNRGTGGLVKAKPSPQEVAVREAIQRIQRGFSRPMTVVVVQPKGGAGKTPTTICLSAAFGAHRGGYVVGWDDNETRGTLAVRVLNPSNQTATAWDLLTGLAAFETRDARVGDLSHYVRAQPDAHFDALVSDDNPGNMEQIGEEEFHRLHAVLQRFYRMIVVDTGNNVRSANWQAAVSAADLVVVVSSYQRDVGYSGSWVLDHLAQTDRVELARNAVTVLTAADPTTDKTVRTQLVEHFTNRTRAVAEIPYDPALAHGGPIEWTELAPATRNAWILAGATVVDALVEKDQQEQARRRAGS